jgi:2-dehydropantoate 2-reductase
MRICVIGAGAIGGFLGARLGASALARGATLASLKQHGWRVKSGNTELTTPTQASNDPAELGKQDLIIIAVKAQAMPSVAATIGPLLGPDTIVLPAMNGVPWWFFDGFGGPCANQHLNSVDPNGRIATAIPTHHVLGCVVHLSASTPEPGLVHHNQGTTLIIGEPNHTDSNRLAEVADIMRNKGLDIKISTNIQTNIWYKLWGNLTINPVSALTGATADRILDDDLVRTFCQQAMKEAQQIGNRIGCPITETPADRNNITRKLGAFRSSMLQDADAGRSLELDALVGAVREIGAIVDVPTPAVDALLGLTRLAAQVRGLK